MSDEKIGALIISRKVGEGICIGGEIQVRINKIKGKTVKLCFIGAKDIRISRIDEKRVGNE